MAVQFRHFFSLPPEIRGIIYKLVICSPKGYDNPELLGFDKMFGEPEIKSAVRYTRDMSLLRVCRQIHEEAAFELYSKTHFKFLDMAYLGHSELFDAWGFDEFYPLLPSPLASFQPFLKSIGNRNLRNIRTLTISISSECFVTHPTSYGANPVIDVRYLVWDPLKMLSSIKRQLSLTLDCSDISFGFLDFKRVLDEIGSPGIGSSSAKSKESKAAAAFRALRGIKKLTVTIPHSASDWDNEEEIPCSEIAHRLKCWVEHVEKKPAPEIGQIQAVAESKIAAIQERLKMRKTLLAKRSQLGTMLRAVESRLQKVDDGLSDLM